MLMLDLFLFNLLKILPSPNYTVIYTTTPALGQDKHIEIEPSNYEMDRTMTPLVHMDLKRDLCMHQRASRNASNGTSLPLFERYQYFTPGKPVYTYTSFVPKLADPTRPIHGIGRWIPSSIYLIRGYLSSVKSPSFLRCIRPRERAGGAEEAAAIVLLGY